MGDDYVRDEILLLFLLDWVKDLSHRYFMLVLADHIACKVHEWGLRLLIQHVWEPEHWSRAIHNTTLHLYSTFA
jgi:hypothetical protein